MQARQQFVMEVNGLQKPRSTIKPMGMSVKMKLEQWFQKKGKPKTILRAEKDALLREIQSTTDLERISLNQLNMWLLKRRRAEKDATSPVTDLGPCTPRQKRTGVEIMFPNLTNAELDYLQILVSETPDPSPDLVAMWTDSSSLPNLTVDDANRYIKYNRARSRRRHDGPSRCPSMLKALPSRDDVDMDAVTWLEDEDMLQDDRDLFDHTHLPTPESTSPEPDTRTLRPDPSFSPMIPLSHDRPNTISPPALSQVPSDPRALLQMLRARLSPADFQTLLMQNGVDDPRVPTSVMSSTSSTYRASPLDSHLPSPTSPLQHRPSRSSNSTCVTSERITTSPTSSFTVALASAPRPKIVASHVTVSGPSSPPLSLSSSSRLNMRPFTCPSTPGLLPRNVLDELVEIFHQRASGDSVRLIQSVDILEPCWQKSDRFLMALEKGELREFGLLPSKELKDMGLEEKGFALDLGDAEEPLRPS